MKAVISPNDTIDLDGTKEEIAFVIREGFRRAKPEPDVNVYVEPKTLESLSIVSEIGQRTVADIIKREEDAILNEKPSAERPAPQRKKRKVQPGGWTDRDVEILKAEKLKGTKDRDIAKKINHSEKAVGVKWCMMNKADKSLRKAKKSKAGIWTAEEDKWLIKDFPHSTEAELCRMLNRPAKEVHARIIELKNSGDLQ